MKILIIGGTSSLGKALKPVLSAFGEVITAGRKNCDVTLDLQDSLDEIKFPSDIDIVIHTAASFGGKEDDEILATEANNVLGTLKLCQAAVHAHVKHFFLISTIFVCLNEDSDHFDIYALSKKHSEEIARFYCSTHSLPLAILRPSQIYGDSDNFRLHQPFFYTLVDRAEQGVDINIYGSKDPRKNFIHIDDLTTIIAKAIQFRVEGTYSILHTKDITFSQIAKAANVAFNSKGNIHFLKDKADILDNIFEKDESLYKIIGYYPQISIEDGMKNIAQYRRNLL